ncbi:MAG: ferritin family protein [candidate division Zixibacteria bacterium]|nr:ferritin family protein [candidate division Zixibacteria bacterium]MDH3937793.1 ferritin family protein [candidate division Zixibacteria bacterium]MDH4035511.1 ferritin family protein [candidate division Zixibacteria bacterium]
MDIIKTAMQMELDGQAFYERGAAATEIPALKKVLLTLAEEEQKHFRIFRDMAQGNLSDAATSLGESSETPAVVRSVFQQMVDDGIESLGGDTVRALWEAALVIEEKSEAMYREAAANETDGERRRLLEKIADEEKNHIYLVDNMLSFAKDPSSFLASAQYKNFMSWEGH